MPTEPNQQLLHKAFHTRMFSSASNLKPNLLLNLLQCLDMSRALAGTSPIYPSSVYGGWQRQECVMCVSRKLMTIVIGVIEERRVWQVWPEKPVETPTTTLWLAQLSSCTKKMESNYLLWENVCVNIIRKLYFERRFSRTIMIWHWCQFRCLF